LDEEIARQKLEYIRNSLNPKGHKVSTSDPFMSLLEGVFSRGTEETAALIEEAWRRGCRLDPWQDYLKKDIWRDLFRCYPEPVAAALSAKPEQGAVPWNMIRSGVETVYLRKEVGNSKNRNLTLPCTLNCTHNCGICLKPYNIIQNNTQSGDIHPGSDGVSQKSSGTATPSAYSAVCREEAFSRRIIFSFTKYGSAVFHSHLSMIEIFSMAFMRSAIPVRYTQGFNPLPALEIVAPLSVGILADGEIAAVETREPVDTSFFLESMNVNLPEGIRLNRAENYIIKRGEKKRSLSSLLWGFIYTLPADPETGREAGKPVKCTDEKTFRKTLADNRGSIFGLRRQAVLASPAGESYGESYFDVYRSLYPMEVSY
jgi:radical SAM-linked protein